MAFSSEEITKLTNMLAAEVKFKLDYRMYLNNKRKLLLVEGSTDQAFIKKIKDENVDCIVAAKVFNSNAKFRTQSTESINCKNAIVRIIMGISHFPSPFLAYEDDVDKWDLYGMVDRDCEEREASRPTARLFITDTHDLETLMLSTDEDLLSRLDECEINQDEINKAYFIAYQLAYARKLLKPYHDELDLQILSTGTRQVDFSAFILDDYLNIQLLISYTSRENSNPCSPSRIKKINESICKGKEGKKVLDEDGNWKQKLDAFVESKPSDFWELVNGHDILQLLLFLNEDAYSSFGDSGGYRLNRSFEMSLIDAYNYKNYSKTDIGKKMIQAGLIKPLYE